jgi:hypothetical protein
MIEIWAEIWLILAVTLTVLYLIATLVGYGPPGTQSLISALVLGPIAATAATATALALVVYWIVVIEAH